jgi:hypothetical protein
LIWAEKSGKASLNRTERTGWPEHDRKLGQDNRDKIAKRGRTAGDRSVSKALREQVSLKVNLEENIKAKLSPSQTIIFMLSFSP